MHIDKFKKIRPRIYASTPEQDTNTPTQGDFGRDSSPFSPWTIRALTSNTCLSLVETLIIANELTLDPAFVQDANGQPYFGVATHFGQ